MRTGISSLDLLQPRTVREALRMMRDEGPLTPLAGCTDVYVGLNFGTLPAKKPKKKAKLFGEIAEEVEEHAMPPWPYRWMHPEARLTDAERKAIVDWASAAEDAALGTGGAGQ